MSKRKKLILFIIMMFVMLIIFSLSNQTAVTSSNESSGILNKILEFICKLGNISPYRINYIINIIHAPIREMMHSLEYFVLGIIVFIFFKSNKYKKAIIISIMFCFIYSATDEIHQLFVIGRNFEYFDLLMDSIGYILGIIASDIVITKIYKK